MSTNDFQPQILAEQILETIQALSGDAVPYCLGDRFAQLPPPSETSFWNTSDNSDITDAMASLGITKHTSPFDLVYVEDHKCLGAVAEKLHPLGKVFLLCNTQDIKDILKEGHKHQLFWAECKSYGPKSGLVLRLFRSLPNPWNGNDTGTILIHSNWGWGDLFQHLRYMPTIRSKMRRVIMEVRPGLESLIAACDLADEVVTKGSPLPKTDYTFELCDSSKYFGFLRSSGYLKLTPEQKTGVNIGVAWRGHHITLNRQRNIDPSLLSSLLLNQVNLNCIQRFTEPTTLPPFIKQHDLTTWLDTAKLITKMDLVVSVDTGVAHLSAALGKPTWVVLAKELYDTPIHTNPSWYESVKIYHNKQDDWTGLFRIVRRDMLSRLSRIY